VAGTRGTRPPEHRPGQAAIRAQLRHELRRYLEAAYLDGGTPTVDGIGIWSWPQMALREWQTIEAIAAWW
jgi:hypothetical protein